MKKSSHAALAAAAICHPHLCADLCGRRHAKSIYDYKNRWMMRASDAWAFTASDLWLHHYCNRTRGCVREMS
ncbi:MAG: hypothetical protein VW647_09630, partial [Alphaproteobacteria bacterium]